MPDLINRFLDRTLELRSKEDIYNYCCELAETFKFDFFCHCIVFQESLANSEFQVVSNYKDEWLQYYLREKCEAYDPVFHYLSTHIKPISWRKLMSAKEHSQQSRDFMQVAADNDLKSGMCFSVHGVYGEKGSLNFSCKQDRDLDAELGDSVHTLDICSRYLHEAAYKIYTQKDSYSDADKAKLTPREKECLLWCAEGKSTWEIAQILQISEGAVAKHLQNTCKKLGVFNRNHAVAKALNTGLFGIEPFKHANKMNIYSKPD